MHRRGRLLYTLARQSLPIKRSFTITVKNAANGDKVTITPTTAVKVTELDVTTAPTETDNDSNDPIPAKAIYTKSDTNNKIVIGTADRAVSTIEFDYLGAPDDTGETLEDDITLGDWTIKVTYKVSQFGKYQLEMKPSFTSNTASDTRTEKLKIPGSEAIEAYVVQSKTTIQSYEIKKLAAGDITQTPQTSGGDIKVLVQNTASTPALQEWVQVDLSITNGKLHPQGPHLRSSSSSKIYDTDDANISGYTSLSVFTTETALGSISGLVNVKPNRNKTATLTAKINGTSGGSCKACCYLFLQYAQDRKGVG